jgi:hypothetical protein
MKDARHALGEHIVPLKAPVDSAGTAFATPWVNLKTALHLTFFYYAGVVTAASADQAVVITVEAATAAASGAEVAVAFSYRKSGATGTDTWGAKTAATSAGYSYGTTDDGSMIAIDIDPAALEAALADASHVRLVVGIDAGGTVTLNAAWAVIDPHYPQVTHQTAS